MTFKYVENSHQHFPEDQYTKEALYLCYDDKYRVLYVRKLTSKGTKFWSCASTGVKKNLEKIYLDSFEIDSQFLKNDVKEFLESRMWEKDQKPLKDDQMPF